MKRTRINKIGDVLPREIASFVRDATLYDSSCSPEARVYFIDKDSGYYLKKSAPGTLAREAELTAYFHKKGLGTRVLQYCSTEHADWFLTAKMAGEDCTHACYLEDPTRLCDALAQQLRALHETDHADCPIQNRTAEYLRTAEQNYRTGNYDTSAFPDSFGYASAQEAYTVLQAGKHALQCDVLLHGDYCLPNIMLDNWRFSGFIDLGNGGVGDRHIDLFWGAWTLNFNLKTDRYRTRFFDAYGRDKIDEEILKTVGAAEVFG